MDTLRISDLSLFDDLMDLNKIFNTCNVLFFNGELSFVKMSYSTKLRHAAGLCISSSPIEIIISLALIYESTQYELINTIVHEMCHAVVFERGDDDGIRDGHGPIWFAHVQRINKEFGLKITKYHYEITDEELAEMKQESKQRMQNAFLGNGRIISGIDIVDLTEYEKEDIVDLTTSSELSVIDLD